MELTQADNAYWSEYGYHRGETVVRNLPEVFAIESTNFCNIKCIMCPRGEPDIMTRDLGHMDTKLFQRILDESTYFTAPCWFHWFGEPLMNPRLFEQIALAKPKVPNLGVSTNATLLNEKNIDRILASDLDTLLIAVDGATKKTYERVRQGAVPLRAGARQHLELPGAEAVSRPEEAAHPALHHHHGGNGGRAGVVSHVLAEARR